jgi:hypothetical protein
MADYLRFYLIDRRTSRQTSLGKPVRAEHANEFDGHDFSLMIPDVPSVAMRRVGLANASHQIT